MPRIYVSDRGKAIAYTAQSSKNFPTYPGNIQQFMKGFFSFGPWGCLGYAPYVGILLEKW